MQLVNKKGLGHGFFFSLSLFFSPFPSGLDGEHNENWNRESFVVPSLIICPSASEQIPWPLFCSCPNSIGLLTLLISLIMIKGDHGRGRSQSRGTSQNPSVVDWCASSCSLPPEKVISEIIVIQGNCIHFEELLIKLPENMVFSNLFEPGFESQYWRKYLISRPGQDS